MINVQDLLVSTYNSANQSTFHKCMSHSSVLRNNYNFDLLLISFAFSVLTACLTFASFPANPICLISIDTVCG